jgi:hypothetical protein
MAPAGLEKTINLDQISIRQSRIDRSCGHLPASSPKQADDAVLYLPASASKAAAGFVSPARVSSGTRFGYGRPEAPTIVWGKP